MPSQNQSGLSLMNPKRAGSEPIGSNVADTKLTTKTAGRPTVGRAKAASREESAEASMVADSA